MQWLCLAWRDAFHQAETLWFRFLLDVFLGRFSGKACSGIFRPTAPKTLFWLAFWQRFRNCPQKGAPRFKTLWFRFLFGVFWWVSWKGLVSGMFPPTAPKEVFPLAFWKRFHGRFQNRRPVKRKPPHDDKPRQPEALHPAVVASLAVRYHSYIHTYIYIYMYTYPNYITSNVVSGEITHRMHHGLKRKSTKNHGRNLRPADGPVIIVLFIQS